MSKCCPNCGSPFEFDELGVMVECCNPSNFDGPDWENDYD
jgi:hypothetical protein